MKNSFLRSIISVVLVTFVFSANPRQQKHIGPKDKLADWTLVIFMEASVDMNQYAIKNITDIVRAGVANHVNVLVEWHSEGTQAWRFHFEDRAMITDNVVDLSKKMEDNIYSTMEWAVREAPAKHYGLILWNHGYGILEPKWFEDKQKWWFATPVEDCARGVCGLKSRDLFEHQLYRHKGICISKQTVKNDVAAPETVHHSYLSNSEMVSLFKRISRKLLRGKKLDYLGADACVEAMLEVMYQVRDYVSYFTGAQDCEMADGYAYTDIALRLNRGYVSPEQLAKTVVDTFELYYKPIAHVGRYTQSATDMSRVECITKKLNQCLDLFLNQIKTDSTFMNLIRFARAQTLSFCLNPSYVDLHTFLMALLGEVQASRERGVVGRYFTEIEKTCTNVCEEIDTAVIANAAGCASARACGISIYFPQRVIDPSYVDTLFAKETKWLEFLRLFQGATQNTL